jgi:hypothetical protein
MMNERLFNESIASDDTAKLRGVLRAIPKWEGVAIAEIRAVADPDMSRMTPEEQHWFSEHMNDQYYMLSETKKALFCGLSVAIATTVENFLGMVCGDYEIPLPDRPNWGHKRNGVEGVIGVGLDTLRGFAWANRAQLLSNCYKHNGGRTNQEWYEQVGGAVDEEIEYENERWAEMIDEVKAFLIEVADRVPVG